MPRARNIKPSFFTNEVLGTLDPIVGMTFIGLWCLADKEGILEDRPLRIKAELFPYREGLDVNGYLTVLARNGFVHRYVVDGTGYIQITNFEKHQHPHHTEKPKGFPKPQGVASEQALAPLNNGVTPSDSLIPDSLIPDSTKRCASPIGFDSFWSAYPKKVGKGAAETAWKKLKPDLETVLIAIKAQSASEQWKKENGQFIPNPATWINQRRWEDGETSAPKAEFSMDDFLTRMGV